MAAEGLRIVSFNILAMPYLRVAEWAARHGHEIVLAVTSPDSHAERYGAAYLDLLARVPPSQDVLVTSHPRRVATPMIRALAPDLIIAATFPHRIPASLTAIPRYGALNYHPAPLPIGRGPNPQRVIYDGHPFIGASLHRIAPEFDAGHVLSRPQRPMPPDLTSELLLATWGELLTESLEEGVPRAVVGEFGEPQDDALATSAAPFSDEERWLDWNEPPARLQQRVVALNLPVLTARAKIGDDAVIITGLRIHAGNSATHPPGTLIERSGNVAIVQTGDGLVEVTIGDG